MAHHKVVLVVVMINQNSNTRASESPLKFSALSDWSEYEHTDKAWERGYLSNLLQHQKYLVTLALLVYPNLKFR